MENNYSNEEWRNIPGFDGMYEVSNCGRVRSNRNPKKRGFIMTAAVTEEENGYKNVHISLCVSGRKKQYRLSRLVWEAFKVAIPQGYHVDHIDNNQLNNRLDNLQLLTLADNNRKRWKDNPDLKSHGGVERVKVRCIETGIIYQSARGASRALGYAGANIWKAIKEPHRTSCGFHWALA